MEHDRFAPVCVNIHQDLDLSFGLRVRGPDVEPDVSIIELLAVEFAFVVRVDDRVHLVVTRNLVLVA